MQSPVHITFRDMAPSPSLSEHVKKRAAKLDTFFDRIQTCRVVVANPNKHPSRGPQYHCRIDLHVPGKDFSFSRSPAEAREDAHAAVDDVFSDAERALEGLADLLRADTKMHLKPPYGIVAKLFPDRGYGFIVDDADGHEVYFHEHSVLDAQFDRIEVGTAVRYAEEEGDKGPQASTVHRLGDTRREGLSRPSARR